MADKDQAAHNEVIKKAAPALKRLEAAKLKGAESVPTEAAEALQELHTLATEMFKLRAEIKPAPPEGATPRQHRDCSQYNTWWNAFKSLLGICDEWQVCMGYCK